MDRKDLAQMVAQRTGISEPQADQAVQVVVQQLASHLPSPIGSHLESFIGGGAAGGGAGGGGGASLGDVASRIEGMLGK